MRNQPQAPVASAADFIFNGQSIRHIKHDNKLWFSATDIANANGLASAFAVYSKVPAEHQSKLILQTKKGQRPCVMVDLQGMALVAVALSLPKFAKWLSTDKPTAEVIAKVKEEVAIGQAPQVTTAVVSGKALTFNFMTSGVRTIVDENSNPWFVGRDVCDVLDIGWNGATTLAFLDSDELMVWKIPTIKGEKETFVISESGLYTLAIRSNKPQAKPFRKWVTAEVLPSIRKTGGYEIPKDLPSALRLAADLGDKVKLLEKKVEHDAPKVKFASQVEESTDTVTMAQLAKLLCKRGYNIGRNRLFDFLKAKEILMFNREPYQRYLNQGWFEVREITAPISRGGIVIQQTLVTGKGQLAIAELIRKEQVRLTAPIANVQRRLAA